MIIQKFQLKDVVISLNKNFIVVIVGCNSKPAQILDCHSSFFFRYSLSHFLKKLSLHSSNERYLPVL